MFSIGFLSIFAHVLPAHTYSNLKKKVTKYLSLAREHNFSKPFRNELTYFYPGSIYDLQIMEGCSALNGPVPSMCVLMRAVKR